MKTNSNLIKAILKSDLSSFIHKCFTTLSPTTQYHNNWHIDMLADYLNSVQKLEIKRLIINIPPRNLKSICVNVAWTSWLLGHDPSTKIISASYSMPLSIKHSIDARYIMQSSWYQDVFPYTKLCKHAKTNKIMTTKNGFRLSSSVGGTITGEGGEFLIIDDPHNPTYIKSDKIREKAVNWYEQTFASRLNDPKNGAIILIMQRLHKDDLAGYLMRNDRSWEVVKLPLYADQNYEYRIGSKIYSFSCGNALDPKRYSQKEIDKLREELKSYNFQAQYMQAPPEKAHVVTPDMLHFYLETPKIEYIIQSWDTASKILDNNDYSVCTTWGFSSGKYYLIDMFRKKVEYPDLKAVALELISQYKPISVLIEDKSSGQSLIQDLRAEKIHCIVPQKPKFDKATRLITCLEMIKNGAIIFPELQNWKHKVISEITTFPNAKHDDILDTITQLLNYAKDIHSNKDPTIRML